MLFLISFICFFNVRASDAMPFFAIAVILTSLTDCYLEIMAKRSTNYPAYAKLSYKEKIKLDFELSLF